MPDSSTRATIAPRLIPQMLADSAARYPSNKAVTFLGRSWTYGELSALVDRATAGLQRAGVVRGTKVGLCLPNTPYYVIFYFAILRAGGTVVNFNPLYVERELAHQIRDSQTEIMITVDLKLVYAKLAAVAAQSRLRAIVVCPMADAMPWRTALLYRLFKRGGTARLDRASPNLTYAALMTGTVAPVPVPSHPSDVAILQYTGGTTGIAKGAALTHANITANTEQLLIGSGVLRMGEERVLGVLPLFHVFAMTCVLTLAVAGGAEMILLPRYELAGLLDVIEQARPTVFPAVPTIYAAINEACAHTPRDLSSIRFCMSGGAPLPMEVRERFMKLTGCDLVEGYGLSETSPVVCFTPPGMTYKAGSVGLAVLGTTIEIRDPDNPSHLLRPNEKGEVCVRGPQVMSGYWGRPDETANTMVGGALRTGDIGYLDEDGYLFLVDRIKDVIIAGGFNIYPRILEEALYQHPAVREAVVIGVPDAYRGQAPKAFVSLHANTTTTPEALKTFLATYVSKIEMPREIVIRDTLPKTLIGKLSKKELIEEEGRGALPPGPPLGP